MKIFSAPPNLLQQISMIDKRQNAVRQGSCVYSTNSLSPYIHLLILSLYAPGKASGMREIGNLGKQKSLFSETLHSTGKWKAVNEYINK